MKISYRILLINFAIVVLILSSSALAFYSIMYEVLTSQQSKYLLNSANTFAYTLREIQQEWLDDLLYLNEKGELVKAYSDSTRFNSQNIDFILIDEGKRGSLTSLVSNSRVLNSMRGNFTLQEFLLENPFTILSSHEDRSDNIYYFGKVITADFLTLISKRINSEIALVENGIPSEMSNELNNRRHLQVLVEACAELNKKDNYKLYTATGGSIDIIATSYRTAAAGNELQFLVFNSISEASGLRSSIQTFIIIIGSAGVVLSLILSFLFTDKIRKQITLLSKATKISKDGRFLNKINLKSKDELGQLASSFNEMIDELEKSQKTKNDYSEFLTLLNQNPSLSEISDAALKKIIKSCGFTAGALYSIYNEEISLTSSFGTKSGISLNVNNDLFYTVAKNKETFELLFEEDSPVISAGIYDISIKYLLVKPVIYNNKVIAILELAGAETPPPEVKEYLANIQDQLAIGLTNGGAFVQLENLVSELKLLNEEYQKQNMQIRQQNETLTELHIKLKEKAEELEIQKEKAEESAKLKSQFLAGVSHELRTPMNSILGLSELILNDHNLDRKNRERLEVVLKNGNRLMNLINEVLDLSKIEAGKMEVYSEPIVLEEIISEAESTVSALAARKNLGFIINRKTDTGVVINSDREKITQVIINLLDNAVKFTEKGSVILSVSLEEDLLKFTVTDTGIGISKKDLEYIFNEFRQVDGSNTRRYSGTGLGLAICKRVADLLNGYISVESEPGKGSTFTFVVPKVLTTAALTVTEKATDQSISRRQVIVIDTDAEMRYTIGQYLISRNYEIVFAENKKEVLEIAAKLNPFAITLDTNLPGSWDLLINLKSNPATRDLAVVLLSILSENNLGYAFGIFEYLVKPITEDQLDWLLSRAQFFPKSRTGRVLIVGSDTQDYEELLREQSIDICVINDQESAFNKTLEFHPDLIIIDLLISNKSSLYLKYQLKSNRETRHIPVVLNLPQKLSDNEKELLNSSVMEITLQSKGHPLDVLKVIRDRFEYQDISFSSSEINCTEDTMDNNPEKENKEDDFIGEVLIVDDDADTLFTINEIVKTCNCKTIIAGSGKECLEVLEHKTPDLILLDIMMPELDGFQTLKKIRQKKGIGNIPVFAVTARAMAEDKEIILKHGFDDYISKPVNSGVIAFKIEKLFSKLKIA